MIPDVRIHVKVERPFLAQAHRTLTEEQSEYVGVIADSDHNRVIEILFLSADCLLLGVEEA